MYCPQCSMSNSDAAKFCRSCGANLSLVPQALTGQLPETRSARRARRRERKDDERPDIARGIRRTFMGFGFLLVALILGLSKPWWGVWMLLPAFALLSKGISEIVIARREQEPKRFVSPPVAPPAPNTGELPQSKDYERLPPPPSVTEGTTKLFDETSGRSKNSR